MSGDILEWRTDEPPKDREVIVSPHSNNQGGVFVTAFYQDGYWAWVDKAGDIAIGPVPAEWRLL